MASLMGGPRYLVAILAVTGTVAMGVGVIVGHFVIPPSGSSPGPRNNLDAAPRTNVTTAATTLVATPSETADPTEPAEPDTADRAGTFPGAPSRINEFGVPVGYPRTEAGAISACGNYVAAYSDVRNREPTRIRQLFRSISLSSVADSLADKIIQIDHQNSQDYSVASITAPNVNFNVRVTGYAVESYADDNAKVAVWGISSFGVYDGDNAGTAPKQGWGTDRCELQWDSGDWKISSAGDGPPGPDIVERSSEGYGRFLLIGAAE